MESLLAALKVPKRKSQWNVGLFPRPMWNLTWIEPVRYIINAANTTICVPLGFLVSRSQEAEKEESMGRLPASPPNVECHLSHALFIKANTTSCVPFNSPFNSLS